MLCRLVSLNEDPLGRFAYLGLPLPSRFSLSRGQIYFFVSKSSGHRVGLIGMLEASHGNRTFEKMPLKEHPWSKMQLSLSGATPQYHSTKRVAEP